MGKEQKDQDGSREPRSRDNSKRELIWNIIFLIAAVVYTISPMDIIPDVLGPLGFTDDVLLWAIIVGMGLLKRFRSSREP